MPDQHPDPDQPSPTQEQADIDEISEKYDAIISERGSEKYKDEGSDFTNTNTTKQLQKKF